MLMFFTPPSPPLGGDTLTLSYSLDAAHPLTL